MRGQSPGSVSIHLKKVIFYLTGKHIHLNLQKEVSDLEIRTLIKYGLPIHIIQQMSHHF